MEILCSVRTHTLLKQISKFKCISTRSAVDLAHKIHGNTTSPPVIILHGLMGSKRNWDSISKNLAVQVSSMVIAVDLRNHGESPHHDSHTYVDLASDVSQLMSKLSIEKANVIGHSMGGRTAMVLALTEPSIVNSLIVVDISPISTPGLLNDFFPRLMDVMKTVKFPEGNILTVANAKGAARHTLSSSGIITDEGTMGLVLMNVGTRYDKKVGWLCNIDALKKHFDEIATFPPEMGGKKYDDRTLFIGGGKSNYLPLVDVTGDRKAGAYLGQRISIAIQRGNAASLLGTLPSGSDLDRVFYLGTDLDKIRDFFPKAQLHYVAEAGHNVHAEDPNSFLKLASAFLLSRAPFN